MSNLITIAKDSEGNDVTEAVTIDKGDFDQTKPGTYEITFTLQGDGFDDVVKTATVTVEEGSMLPVSDIADLKKLVEQYDESGEFSNDQTVHALKLHLTALEHFEKTGNNKKVVKHLNGLKDLLDHQKKGEQISAEAYKALTDGADTMIDKLE